MEKVIIVEGMTDKKKILQVINEPVEVICTYGTLGIERLDELLDELFDEDVYILVDADEAGERLRKMFKREFPEAKHIYIDKMYREVAAAPFTHLASVLLQANISVHEKFL